MRGATNVLRTPECGSTLACSGALCGTTLQNIEHFGPSARQRERAAEKAARFAGLGAAPRDYAADWHDCLSVRRCVNFSGAGDGVGGASGVPCANAGRLVSRDGNAALNLVGRGLIDMLGLEVPAHFRKVAGGRPKPPALRLERTVR